jgi:hypothetical protein
MDDDDGLVPDKNNVNRDRPGSCSSSAFATVGEGHEGNRGKEKKEKEPYNGYVLFLQQDIWPRKTSITSVPLTEASNGRSKI